MSSTGEVVALAEAAVDLSELRFIAQALVAAALASSTADLFALGFPAGAEKHVACLTLLAFTAGTQVAGLTLASPTVISTCKEKVSLTSLFLHFCYTHTVTVMTAHIKHSQIQIMRSVYVQPKAKTAPHTETPSSFLLLLCIRSVRAEVFNGVPHGHLRHTALAVRAEAPPTCC